MLWKNAATFVGIFQNTDYASKFCRLSDSDTTGEDGEGGVTYAQVIKVRCFQFAGIREEIPAIVADNEAIALAGEYHLQVPIMVHPAPVLRAP
jgi:hypothetical protein